MNSKSGLREISLSIPTGNLSEAIISYLEPIWRTTGLISDKEIVSAIQFNVEGLDKTVVPVTVKIKKEKEVYFSSTNA